MTNVTHEQNTARTDRPGGRDNHPAFADGDLTLTPSLREMLYDELHRVAGLLDYADDQMMEDFAEPARSLRYLGDLLGQPRRDEEQPAKDLLDSDALIDERDRIWYLRDAADGVLDNLRDAAVQWMHYRTFGDETDDLDNPSGKLERSLVNGAGNVAELIKKLDSVHNRLLQRMNAAGIKPGPAPHTPRWPA